MKLLFIHQNFPGQYKHLLNHFIAAGGHELVGIGERDNVGGPVEGMRLYAYPKPDGPTPGIHHYVRDLEAAVRRGQATAKILLDLKTFGFRPDLVCVHPGWGDALFLQDIYPDVKVLAYQEYFYHAVGTDVGFDAEFAPQFDDLFRVRMMNSTMLHSLAGMDWGVTPTRWQWSQYPSAYRDRISVIHEGIDTDVVQPNPAARINLVGPGIQLSPQDEVITFVNRNLEPYRGFHSFMRAIPDIQQRRPRAQILIVGGDEVSYGQRFADGRSYREHYLAELGSRIDLSRVHFLGNVPYETFLSLLQISAVHVYLTYPFVLGWSMLEAMAAGCAVVGSATPPVQEVITDGDNGLLVDFFSPSQIAASVDRVLSHPDRMAEMRARARGSIVGRYDLKTRCLPQHVKLIEDLVAGRQPGIGG